MPSVFLDSPTNSTMFTTCCRCAICDDQSCCPKCGVKIEQQGTRERWQYAYGNQRRAKEIAHKQYQPQQREG